ncbi:unnamed protein product [Adineta ricciae]|uniref:Thyroglobulin type-1 domain-containing protein n=1 Tax=Adineta ricciae TaxID=249248 RepID=A0A814NZC5_ADIRI|nr:unnamed protein product [Adineta ricciae]
MLAWFCLCLIVIQSNGNPVLSNESNVTESDVPSQLICEQNIAVTSNNSLYELLNYNRFWFVSTRSKYIYGERTWRNVLMETSTNGNASIGVEFFGEEPNGTCVSSEKGQMTSNSKSNRVGVQWANSEGFIDLIYMDERMIHLILCYSTDSNQTNLCAHNQSEQFVVDNNQANNENDTMDWLKSHCLKINPDDFIINDNPEKCMSMVTQPQIVLINSTKESNDNQNETSFQTIITEHENVTNGLVVEEESTTRSNRTNRLEILEEYYNNTTEDQFEGTTAVEIKPIVLLSALDESNRTNITIIEENEFIGNDTIDQESPSIVLHKMVFNESTTESSFENETNLSTSPHTHSVISTTVRSILNESRTIVEVQNTTEIITTERKMPATTEQEVPTTTENEIPSTTAEKEVQTAATTEKEVPTTTEREVLTTTEMKTTTIEVTTIPADCLPLKDCPFDHCAFARKFDNHGCPTCNCLQSNKSNITCPALACQPCLYGHFTDPNGCSVCQCQSRPFPPLGERCPQLNCEPCYFGTVKDEYNCDTCICIRPNNQECPVLDCPFGLCKHGSTKDEDDCPTCDCLLPTENVTEVNCSTTAQCPPCHLGYVKDANGCETCQCKLRGSVPCASVESQCHCDYGSYLNPDGCETCSCLPDPKNASRQACWELSNHANLHNITGPTCSLDGSFYARQCDKTHCWCVTPTGLHINGFESRPDENVNCACAVELYQVSSLRMIGHHLLCLLNGNYAPIQCDGRYCSCVDENGKTIGPSVSVQNRDQLRCVGVYQQLHPERFVLHRSSVEISDPSHVSYGISSSLCLKHLEQVRNANVTDEHILIPECDANGLYSSVQCDQNERYCWCVDKKTGVEMDGTRRLNARPNCVNQETQGGTFKNIIDDPATKPHSHEYAEKDKEKCCSTEKPCGNEKKPSDSNECGNCQKT